MKHAERLAALEALLARVQANAGSPRVARAPEGWSLRGAPHRRASHEADEGHGAAAEGAAVVPPQARPARAAAPLPRAAGLQPPVDAVDLGDWSSLLERDLRDPSPTSPTPPPVVATHALASARRPSVPPPVAARQVDAAPRDDEAVEPGDARPSRPAPADLDDEPPASELERAIRAAVAVGASPIDAHRLWSEAASQLRGRRSLALVDETEPRAHDETEPRAHDETEPRAPVDAPETGTWSTLAGGVPDGDVAPRLEVVTSRPPPSTHDPSSAPLIVHEDADEPPRGRRVRRASRGRRATAIPVVAMVVVAGAVVTWGFGERGPAGSPRTARSVVAARAIATGPGATTPTAAATSPTAPIATPPHPTPSLGPSAATPPAAPAAIASAAGRGVVPAAPPIARPFDHGLLHVDADPVSEVYLQGIRAGESGRWLEVPCGARNVRLARPGAPPPGHSYPMWLGAGRTLIVPCGGTQTFRWTWD